MTYDWIRRAAEACSDHAPSWKPKPDAPGLHAITTVENGRRRFWVSTITERHLDNFKAEFGNDCMFLAIPEPPKE